MTSKEFSRSIVAGFVFMSSPLMASQFDVTITIENLAPANGNFLTPHWVGFHDGTFDIYDSGTPASSRPEPGSNALEALAEDGNNGPMSEVFSRLQAAGVDGTIAGPNGPIAPGDIATATFRLESTDPLQRYFSYASMILPSNDFFYANANPLAHKLFDDSGNFVATDFFVGNGGVRDAGTEVNDEIPLNTAFFGQQQPNTGVDENGNILVLGNPLVRFQPVSEGGVLADAQFAMADFTVPGYPLVKISFTATPVQDNPVFSGPIFFRAALEGDQEVPPVATNAVGIARYAILGREGDVLQYSNVFGRRTGSNIVMAHLHLGAAGENGPVVANLLADDFDVDDPRQTNRVNRQISGLLRAENLLGPLAGRSLGALTSEILAGNIYINIHTQDVPSGELRGQLIAQ